MNTVENNLCSGLQSLALLLNEKQIQQLLDFINLIAKWNKTYNLTAIRNLDDMVSLHLLDSLAILPFIAGNRVIDIGTGAGLPGIPLAICSPYIHFTLLDSNAKKTRFVQQAVLELNLTNVTVYHQRVEDFLPEQLFETVLTRAFTNLADIVRLTNHLLTNKGVLLAMKGQYPESELIDLKANATVIPMTIPGIAAQRCLVKIESSNTGVD